MAYKTVVVITVCNAIFGSYAVQTIIGICGACTCCTLVAVLGFYKQAIVIVNKSDGIRSRKLFPTAEISEGDPMGYPLILFLALRA